QERMSHLRVDVRFVRFAQTFHERRRRRHGCRDSCIVLAIETEHPRVDAPYPALARRSAIEDDGRIEVRNLPGETEAVTASIAEPQTSRLAVRTRQPQRPFTRRFVPPLVFVRRNHPLPGRHRLVIEFERIAIAAVGWEE